MAKTDPYQQITDTVGCGPFKFVREEFEPGHKAVYVRNPDYVPRREPPDWASGGKIVKLDRVEWLIVAEPSTAAAALASGEVDCWENPSPDLAPMACSGRAIFAKAALTSIGCSISMPTIAA